MIATPNGQPDANTTRRKRQRGAPRFQKKRNGRHSLRVRNAQGAAVGQDPGPRGQSNAPSAVRETVNPVSNADGQAEVSQPVSYASDVTTPKTVSDDQNPSNQPDVPVESNSSAQDVQSDVPVVSETAGPEQSPDGQPDVPVRSDSGIQDAADSQETSGDEFDATSPQDVTSSVHVAIHRDEDAVSKVQEPQQETSSDDGMFVNLEVNLDNNTASDAPDLLQFETDLPAALDINQPADRVTNQLDERVDGVFVPDNVDWTHPDAALKSLNQRPITLMPAPANQKSAPAPRMTSSALNMLAVLCPTATEITPPSTEEWTRFFDFVADSVQLQIWKTYSQHLEAMNMIPLGIVNGDDNNDDAAEPQAEDPAAAAAENQGDEELEGEEEDNAEELMQRYEEERNYMVQEWLEFRCHHNPYPAWDPGFPTTSIFSRSDDYMIAYGPEATDIFAEEYEARCQSAASMQPPQRNESPGDAAVQPTNERRGSHQPIAERVAQSAVRFEAQRQNDNQIQSRTKEQTVALLSQSLNTWIYRLCEVPDLILSQRAPSPEQALVDSCFQTVQPDFTS